jgi:hypothetical protein
MFIATSIFRMLRRPPEAALTDTVGVVHQSIELAATPDRHHQRITDEPRVIRPLPQKCSEAELWIAGG